jgi:hypothetical protein
MAGKRSIFEEVGEVGYSHLVDAAICVGDGDDCCRRANAAD